MSDSGPGRREVAHRLFAAEFDDAEFSYSESDEERAPNYVVTPTGARANRLFAVGVLTEVEDVNPEMVRGRVVDPTGAFVTYAGQYQPEALAFLERADPPTFLALTGKARTFEPDDGDRIYTSVRPESVSEVDAETRDRAAVVAAERTLERIGVMASAVESDLTGDRLRAALVEAGVDERLADGVALALEYYGTTPAYLEALRELSLDVARVVAGEVDEVGSVDVAPGEGTGDAAPLATLDLSAVSLPESASTAAAESAADSEPTATAADESDTDEATASTATTESPTTSDPGVETDTGTETGSTAATGAEPDEATATTASEPDTGAVSGTDPAPADAGEADVDETTEPETESGSTDEPADGSATDDLGTEAGGDEPGDFDPGEYELDEEERREVEEEYGTEFSTADRVEDPDVGSPDPDTAPEAGADAEATPETGAEPGAQIEPESEPEAGAEPESEPEVEAEAEPKRETATETGSEPEPADEPEPEPEADATAEDEAGGAESSAEGAAATAEDVDLEDAVVETMESLDDGDGADHDEVVASVVDEYGADPEAVEAAVQDALMSGRCYEPSDGTLKSI